MTCRLCKRRVDLVKSHILPEFLFRPAYDEKHRMKEVALPEFRSRVVQKGYREELLCFSCEARFSRYENYFAKVWYGRSSQRPLIVREPYFLISGLDYALFKLFHLSVLWRAGVSSLKNFEMVALGPHLQALSKLLLSDDPGEASHYPIGAMALVNPATHRLLEGFVVSPQKRKIEGHHVYAFIFGGCLWVYRVSSHEAEWFPLSLTKSGKFFVPCGAFDEVMRLTGLLQAYAKAMHSDARRLPPGQAAEPGGSAAGSI